MEKQIEIIPYSEKAIAVTGDTKPLKDILRALGGRFNMRLHCGPGWIFKADRIDALFELQQCGEISAETLAIYGLTPKDITERRTPKKAAAKGAQDYAANLREYYSLHPEEKQSWGKYYEGAVKVGTRYYLLAKPHINTRFCWSDEGESLEEYKRTTGDKKRLARYFFNANMDEFDGNAKGYGKPDNGKTICLCKESADGTAFIVNVILPNWGRNADEREVTPDELKAIAAGEAWQRERFEKRLHTYLKRYGTEKLTTWTYWADR